VGSRAQERRRAAALTALRVAFAVHQEHANGLAQQPRRLEVVPSVPNHGLAVKALASQLRSSRMQHLLAGSRPALTTVGARVDSLLVMLSRTNPSGVVSCCYA